MKLDIAILEGILQALSFIIPIALIEYYVEYKENNRLAIGTKALIACLAFLYGILWGIRSYYLS